MNNVDSLLKAIHDKNLCAIRSKNDKAERIVEPHIIYKSPSGNVLLDFWQTAGYSSSGGLPCWKRLIITDVVSVRILDDRFIIRKKEGFNQSNKKRYTRTICCVES